MKKYQTRMRRILFSLTCLLTGFTLPGQTGFRTLVSPETLYGTVDTLSSEEFEGRLTGHRGYNRSVEWVTGKFASWGIKPLGENGGFLQYFPQPYNDVLPGCELILHAGSKGEDKSYEYVEEFIPGSTSGNGELTAEVVYAGYGISAPELGYDDYAGMDVQGKIVLLEREAPVGPEHKEFLSWRPYTFHQYKLHNAVRHGAAGMLYNYHIANPNNDHVEGFVYSHVGNAVMEDLFRKNGHRPEKTVEKIGRKRVPRSFETGKTVTLKNITKYHPDGVGSNVIGMIEGSDPNLKNEYILVGGHLDHLGKCYTTMPGANDNASAVSVTLGLAEALSKSGIQLKRSVVFVLFGAEEAALKGVQYFLKHPTIPGLDQVAGFINMDGVGIGDKIHVLFAKNNPGLYAYLEEANRELHLSMAGSFNANITRPRLDAAFADWYGIPVLSIYTDGPPEAFANFRYHTPYDNIGNIDKEIMTSLAELLYLSIINMCNAESLDFERGEIQHGFIE
ncbi:MAG: M28 family peptidase [Bacteroidota bacterium]